MKFVYGKQDWRTAERGEENCYLLTNGLGGFSSATLIGSCTRNDHALLMAAVKAPNCRFNMIHHLEEELYLGKSGRRIYLSSQDYIDGRQEDGYRYLDSFSFEDYPCWRYRAEGVEIQKEIAMEQGENTVAVRYFVENRSSCDVLLTITPHLQFVPKGTCLEGGQEFQIKEGVISSNGYQVYYDTNGITEVVPQKLTEGFYYAYDACDGRNKMGNSCVNHRIIKQIPAGQKEECFLLYRMKQESCKADEVFERAVRYRNELTKQAGLSDEIGKVLVKSADQFISERESTGGKTILAGYPFFEDWGRDTMIALPGCCISTGRLETAKSILSTFAAYCKDGLMPNLFPEGGNEPLYNTVDAALLFLHAMYQYEKKSVDLDFLSQMWPVMEEIITHYKQGTKYHIGMDKDGLIQAGAGLEQVTWMDVRVGEILPTPRHGKPVEVNAYWYNGLRTMEEMGKLLGKDVREYKELAEQVKESFVRSFWNEEKGCLRDVISGTKADEQIRCNQIWAVSMPFSLLDEEKERRVVDTVFEKLYTPYGLRTLEMEDGEFVGSYGGKQFKRDLAYHQGTVWVFPLGAYYLAYLKVNKKSREAVATVRGQLTALESALREGCVGQLPEIYDGANPTVSRGCFAQAWSVGELLRVFAELEELDKEEQ